MTGNHRGSAMADKERFESLAGIEQDVQITERTRDAMENYFNWVQNAMSASHRCVVRRPQTRRRDCTLYSQRSVGGRERCAEKISMARMAE